MKRKSNQKQQKMGGIEPEPHQVTNLKQGCPSLFLEKSSLILKCTFVNHTISVGVKPKLANLSAQWLPSL